jgi:hypothetical protein
MIGRKAGHGTMPSLEGVGFYRGFHRAVEADGLPLLVGVAGDLGQGPLGVGAAVAGPLQLPRPILGCLVQLGAQPVALGAQLLGGELAQVGSAGGVDRQGLVAGPDQGLDELAVAVGGLQLGQVQLDTALGFGPDHRVQGGLVPGAGQLHVQPVAVLAAGQPHQRPPPGEGLGAMPGGGVGQVDAAVALPAAAAVQVPPWERDLPRVLAVQAERQGPLLRVQSGDRAASAVGHPQLADGVLAADHPIPDR